MNFELNQDWLKGDLPGLQEAEGLNNKRIHSNQSNIQAMSINKGHGSSVGPVFAVAPEQGRGPPLVPQTFRHVER